VSKVSVRLADDKVKMIDARVTQILLEQPTLSREKAVEQAIKQLLSEQNGTAQPKCIALTGVCPHCGEEVTVTATKQQLKEMLKGFKLPMREANRYGDSLVKLDPKTGKVL
jgi:Rieske Fe-S protein